MKPTLKLIASALLPAWLLAAWPAGAAELLSHAEWPIVRSGSTLLNMPALQRVVTKMDRMEDGRLVIRYPGGDRGNAWAVELRDWLVALGIGSELIVLEPGSGIPDTIVLYAEARAAR